MQQFRLYTNYLCAVGRLRLAGVIALVVAFSLSEGLGLAVLVAVLQTLGLNLGADGTMGQIAAAIKSGFNAVGLQPTLSTLLILYVLAMGARSMLGRAQSVAIFSLEQRFVLSLRTRLYRAIANANWLFLSRSRATDYTQALTQECSRLGEATFLILTFTADLIVATVLIAFAFSISPAATMIVLAAGIVLLLVYSRRVRKLHDDGTALSEATKVLYAASIEHTQSLKVAKAYSAQGRMTSAFVGAAQRVSDAYTAISRRQAALGSSFEIGWTITLAVLLFVAAEMMKISNAAILALLLVFWRLMPLFLSAHGHVRNFVSDLPAFVTIINLVRQCEEAGEKEQQQAAPSFQRELRFENVSFGYGRDGDPTVANVNLTISPRSITALAGASGSGKSTIADLAMGLLSPDSGRILADGEPLTAENVRAWREQIGYVGPDTPLFHATLRENLRWAQPDATEADMIAALELAAAKELVLSLPDGLDTMVGDRGVLFSQGERQRIGLARALLRRPRLLILDEATSGLDADTEASVMSAMAKLQDVTILLIAHRRSTLNFADTIVVVEDRTVAESGARADLERNASSRFRELLAAQDAAPAILELKNAA